MANAYTQATGIQRVVAWRLRAPSYGGGKVYTVAVVGSDVWTAWGRSSAAGAAGAGSQAKILRFATPTAADAEAWQKTLDKQEGGYTLDIAPRWCNVDPTSRSQLGVLDFILRHGEPIPIYS